jgi:aspartyl-tRNA(Asn)/glutamyl-tRNA(Gln) amidotransferase subunit B
MGEVSKRLNVEDLSIAQAPLEPATLAKLVARVADGTVSSAGARTALAALWSDGGGDVDAVIEAKGLKQMSDSGALEAIVDQVLAANPKSIDEYKAGKDKAVNALVGQVMKASRGLANPGQVNELLKKKLVR